MNTTLTGSGSSFVNEMMACVATPLTSLIPKISEEGKEAETFIARSGVVSNSGATSSSYSVQS